MYIDFGSYSKKGDMAGFESASYLVAGGSRGGYITFIKNKDGDGWIEWRSKKITTEELVDFIEREGRDTN